MLEHVQPLPLLKGYGPKETMDHAPDKKFPLNAKDYMLYEEVGEGVSATVYRALCIPLDEAVAIKVLDLEKCNSDLDGIRREAQTMSLINHPNLLRAHCSFTTGHSLWVVMPYMAGGSCLHIMKSAYPEGLEEPVIATLLREVLKALVYLHAHGHIHRDVKAGNILIASNGAVKLADFGVSACMFDTGDRQRSRNTFVGTPCWMAPEVMQQLHGYDFKADIWSFGITALELAHGHAPFSKYPPMKVLLMTLQNAPPGLDYERDKRFSKSFKEMVATCLVKDPKKRPTSEKLLKHSFFKHARSTEYLARAILEGLAPLGERFKMLKAQEAALLVQNKAPYEDKEQLSQQEYIRGISAWNFNLEDLKSQAALIQENDGVPNIEDSLASIKQERHDASGRFTERILPEMVNHSNTVSGQEDALNDLHDLKSSLASFPMKPLQALKGCFDVGEDDANTSPSWDDTRSDSDEQLPTKSSPRVVHQEAGRNDDNNDDFARSRSFPCQEIPNHKKFLSGPLIQDTVASAKKIMDNGDRDHLPPKYQSERNYSGPLLYRQRKETNCLSPEDTSEGAVVQHKGRFKVTSADVNPKGMTNCSSGLACGGSSSPMTPNLAASLLPSLQWVLQQNIIQREEITKLIKYTEQISGNQGDLTEVGTNNSLQAQVSCASTREKELQSQYTHLHQCVTSLFEELQNLKLKNAQLEKQLNALTNRDKRIRGMTKA